MVDIEIGTFGEDIEKEPEPEGCEKCENGLIRSYDTIAEVREDLGSIYNGNVDRYMREHDVKAHEVTEDIVEPMPIEIDLLYTTTRECDCRVRERIVERSGNNKLASTRAENLLDVSPEKLKDRLNNMVICVSEFEDAYPYVKHQLKDVSNFEVIDGSDVATLRSRVIHEDEFEIDEWASARSFIVLFIDEPVGEQTREGTKTIMKSCDKTWIVLDRPVSDSGLFDTKANKIAEKQNFTSIVLGSFESTEEPVITTEEDDEDLVNEDDGSFEFEGKLVDASHTKYVVVEGYNNSKEDMNRGDSCLFWRSCIETDTSEWTEGETVQFSLTKGANHYSEV